MNISKLKIIISNEIKDFQNLVFNLFSYLYIKIYFIFLLLVNFLIWLTAFSIDSKIDGNQIALHYNVDFGIDYYGDKNKIYIIPLLGFIIILVNLFFLINMHKSRDRKFISHVLLTSALVSNIILLTAIISVYLINFW
jgi:hypothetical protein